jgi:methyl-accepting chemotaxis protein
MGLERPVKDAMSERRNMQRTRVSRNAQIVLTQPSNKVHCTLHDLTNTGARLSVASTSQVPDTFELTLDQGRSRRPCRVKWRTDSVLGVSFEKPTE